MANTVRPRAASLLSLDLRMPPARLPERAPEEADDPKGQDEDITETLAKIGALVRKMAAVR